MAVTTQDLKSAELEVRITRPAMYRGEALDVNTVKTVDANDAFNLLSADRAVLTGSEADKAFVEAMKKAEESKAAAKAQK